MAGGSEGIERVSVSRSSSAPASEDRTLAATTPAVLGVRSTVQSKARAVLGELGPNSVSTLSAPEGEASNFCALRIERGDCRGDRGRVCGEVGVRDVRNAIEVWAGAVRSDGQGSRETGRVSCGEGWRGCRGAA